MADKTYENVVIEREGEVTFLYLNRPEKRNAMSPGLHYDMQDALLTLDTDAQTLAADAATQILISKAVAATIVGLNADDALGAFEGVGVDLRLIGTGHQWRCSVACSND